MKVAFDTSMLYMDKAGIHYYTKNLLKAIMKSCKHECKLILYPLASLAGKYGHIHAFQQLPNFIKLIKQYNCDLVYIPHPRLYAHLFLSALCDMLNRPLIITIHDVHFLVRTHGISYKLTLLPRYSGISSLSRLFDSMFFTTVSRFSKYCMTKYLGIPGSKIEVIYPAIDEMFYSNISKELSERCIKEIFAIERPYILYVGPIHPSKGVLTLIRAYKIAKKKGLKHKLVIAGPLRMKAQVFKQFSKVNSIRYLGYISREHLPYLYSAADAFVFLSIHEGFGLPVAEAAACGCPLILSSIPVFKEIWREVAIFVKPYKVEEIAEILLSLNSFNLERLGFLAKQRAKDFQPQNVAKRIIYYWKKILRNMIK